jgi:acetolactate synthase small subunit
MKHIIAVLLENEPEHCRASGLFSARGYNIESLTVAPTEDPSLSRMTILTTGSDDVIEQITKHLNRLIEVVKVVDLTEGAYTERELMMVKVRAGQGARRNEAHGGHLPRPHHRRDRKELHRGADRRPVQERRLPASH